jgi:hypothetical protein
MFASAHVSSQMPKNVWAGLLASPVVAHKSSDHTAIFTQSWHNLSPLRPMLADVYDLSLYDKSTNKVGQAQHLNGLVPCIGPAFQLGHVGCSTLGPDLLLECSHMGRVGLHNVSQYPTMPALVLVT